MPTFATMRTPNGHLAGEVASALQKSIRRGLERDDGHGLHEGALGIEPNLTAFDFVDVGPLMQPPLAPHLVFEMLHRVGDENLRAGNSRLLHRPVLVRRVPFADPVEGGGQVVELLVGVTGLTQLVATEVPQRRDAVTNRGVGMVTQPLGRLHDVGVGIVDDAPGAVRHVASLLPVD